VVVTGEAEIPHANQGDRAHCVNKNDAPHN
jgi:hypothetical protein